ncbi:MAG: metallophosphoesterase family protein, partial [Cetobacterium sp.]
VWGAGFNEKHVREPLIKSKTIDGSKINIMVLHGDISNKNSINDYNPIYLEDIRNSGMDYIALGHRHVYSEILREGKTSFAYSGCPQGRGFDEEGSKGVIIGDVYSGGVKLNFYPICKREYIVKDIEVSNCKTYQQIQDAIYIKCSGEKKNNNLFKIILTGAIDEHFNINEDVLLQKLKSDFYFIKIVNKTTIKINLENLAEDYSVKGKFILKMLEKINEASEEEKEVLNKALKLGIQCLSEEAANLDDY